MASRGASRTKASPGAAVKAIRTARQWTLADLAARTGLTASTLSKIENDKIALNLEKLIILSQALDVDMSELISAARPGGPAAPPAQGSRRSLTREGEGQLIEMPRGNYLYAATDLLHKRMTPIIGEVFAKDISEYGAYHQHPGEEYVYVVQGVLDIYTDTYAPIRLNAGDSLYFDATMGHAYVAVGDEPCKILSVCAAGPAEAGSVRREAAGAAAPHAVRALADADG